MKKGQPTDFPRTVTLKMNGGPQGGRSGAFVVMRDRDVIAVGRLLPCGCYARDRYTARLDLERADFIGTTDADHGDFWVGCKPAPKGGDGKRACHLVGGAFDGLTLRLPDEAWSIGLPRTAGDFGGPTIIDLDGFTKFDAVFGEVTHHYERDPKGDPTTFVYRGSTRKP